MGIADSQIGKYQRSRRKEGVISDSKPSRMEIFRESEIPKWIGKHKHVEWNARDTNARDTYVVVQ
jgi:hypothetical protein